VTVSTAKGAEQNFHVDTFCGGAHHWVGDYTYHLESQTVSITCVGKPRNWINPSGQWKVAGQAVNPGPAQPIKADLQVSFPGYPSSTEAPRKVTITATATNDTLVLRNDPADGNYSVSVEYQVTEALNASDPPQSWKIDVDIEGQGLVYSDAYIKALQACWQQRIRGLTSDVKGVDEMLAELADLIKNHRGPPINEKVLTSLARQARDNSVDLRRFSRDLNAVRRSVDMPLSLRRQLAGLDRPG
jgi:hypothetical protein